MKQADILDEYITIPTSVSANPSKIEIGETYSGVAQNREILLTGYGLQPQTGVVNIAAGGNVTVSLDKETYSTSVNVNYAGGSLFQKLYVQATYTAAGDQADSIVVTSGAVRMEIPVTASVVSLVGGSAVSATWPIAAKNTATDVTVEGPVAAAMTMQLMMAYDLKAEFTDGDQTNVGMVRLHNADASGSKTDWPTDEIDENASRYIDFAMTAPTTMDVRITNITMDIAAHSTSAMCYHINTGFGDSFTDVQTIAEKVNMTNKAIEHLTFTPTLTIPAGETLHVRVLPWHQHTKGSGKYIGLKNVVIEGQAFDTTTGIEAITNPSPVTNKVLHRGQLLIVRDKRNYNVIGELVR